MLKKIGDFMKNNTLSIIAIIIAIIAIIITLCARCNDGWDFDLYGALIGILSLLVTLLLGWQIFNHLSFEEKLNKRTDGEIQKAKDLIYEENRNNINIAKYKLIAFTSSEMAHNIINPDGKINRAFKYAFDALMAISRSNENDMIEPLYPLLIEIINNEELDKSKFAIRQIDHWINEVPNININNERKAELLTILSTIREASSASQPSPDQRT